MSNTRLQGQSLSLRLDQYETVIGELFVHFPELTGKFLFHPTEV